MTQRLQFAEISALFRGSKAPKRSERSVEEAEPARQVLLDRQLTLELRLQLELLGVVALLLLPGRHERIERAPLVAVDPVDRMLPAVEAEHGRQKLRAEALLLEPLRNGMDGGDLILELRVAHHDPGEAEAVLLAREPRSGLRRDRVENLLEIGLGAHELAGRQRL